MMKNIALHVSEKNYQFLGLGKQSFIVFMR